MRVLFARVSWMTFYNGSPEDTPQGQMAYVVERRGPVAERFNFSPVHDKVYGYVTQTRGTPYHLERIDPAARRAGHLDGVLLIFMAARPATLGGGQVVVGWYRRAKLYREYKYGPRRATGERSIHCCEAATPDAFLLPTPARTWHIPTGRGGMRQAKIRYFDHGQAWMRRLLAQIDNYKGPSLVAKPEVEAEAIAASAGEVGHAGGQGFAGDHRIRRLVEQRAIAAATKVYSAAGYKVEIVGHPFDLHCYRNAQARQELWVEVKGSQGKGDQIILTRGEVEFYSKHFPRTELVVVNSIRVKKGTARGGQAVRYRHWRARAAALRPIAYWYRPPAHSS